MGEAAEMALDQPYEGASGWVRWSDCAICRTPASGASATGPVSRRRGGFSSIPQRSPQRTRSGSSLPPQKFRRSSAAVPQRFRSGSAAVPHFLRSGSAVVPRQAAAAHDMRIVTRKSQKKRIYLEQLSHLAPPERFVTSQRSCLVCCAARCSCIGHRLVQLPRLSGCCAAKLTHHGRHCNNWSERPTWPVVRSTSPPPPSD